MSDPPPPEVSPEPSEYPGRSPAFRRIMRAWGMEPGEGQKRVRELESQVSDVMKVTDEELVILYRLHIQDIAIEAEVARRNIDALVAFKNASATASNRLETLTKWLIVFTSAVVLLTVVLVVHDLTR